MPLTLSPVTPGSLTISPGQSGGLHIPFWAITNVTEYGALGDGVTDETTAINRAIAALNGVGGGTLYFPKGTYKVSSALTAITVPTVISGASSTGSILEPSVTGLDVLTLSTGNIAVRDLQIRWLGAVPSAGAGIRLNFSSLAYRPVIDNVFIQGTYYGIRANDYAQLMTVQNCYILDFVKYGIWREYGGNLPDNGDDVFHGNTIATSQGVAGSAGIRMDAHGGPRISSNKIGGGTLTVGIDFQIADGVATSVSTITGNSIEGPATGIRIGPSGTTGTFGAVSVTGNEFSCTTGVNVGNGVTDVTITGNTFNATTGVNVSGSASTVGVSGNTFLCASGTAVKFSSTCYQCVLGTNTYEGVMTLVQDDAPGFDQTLQPVTYEIRDTRFLSTSSNVTYTNLWRIDMPVGGSCFVTLMTQGYLDTVGSEGSYQQRWVDRDGGGNVAVSTTGITDFGGGSSPTAQFDVTTTGGSMYVGLRKGSAAGTALNMTVTLVVEGGHVAKLARLV